VSGEPSAYDRLAPIYDNRWPRYLSLSIDLARSHLFANPGETLVDVGCGTGQLLELVVTKEPDVHAYGVEPSEGMLAVARRRVSDRTHLIRGEASRIPLDAASADWLVSTSALHLFEDPAKALGEFHRVLRPGGQLVLVDWAHDFVMMRVMTAWLQRREAGRIRVYRAIELEHLLVKSGFEAVRVRARRMTWFWGMLVATAQRRR